jgi:dephospho-CoA kinase
MLLVGLTGGIGSGKSEAARIFTGLGVPVIDTDAIAHLLTASGQPLVQNIINLFGDEFLNPDGSLNRAALREKIFADENARRQLEAILHPAIYDEVLQAIDRHPEAPYQIIAVPLLFESDRYQKLIQRSLLIDCDETLQIRRTTARSGLPASAVEAIMHAQMPRVERIKRADDIITNDQGLPELQKKIEELHQIYLHTC